MQDTLLAPSRFHFCPQASTMTDGADEDGEALQAMEALRQLFNLKEEEDEEAKDDEENDETIIKFLKELESKSEHDAWDTRATKKFLYVNKIPSNHAEYLLITQTEEKCGFFSQFAEQARKAKPFTQSNDGWRIKGSDGKGTPTPGFPKTKGKGKDNDEDELTKAGIGNWMETIADDAKEATKAGPVRCALGAKMEDLCSKQTTMVPYVYNSHIVNLFITIAKAYKQYTDEGEWTNWTDDNFKVLEQHSTLKKKLTKPTVDTVIIVMRLMSRVIFTQSPNVCKQYFRLLGHFLKKPLETLRKTTEPEAKTPRRPKRGKMFVSFLCTVQSHTQTPFLHTESTNTDGDNAQSSKKAKASGTIAGTTTEDRQSTIATTTIATTTGPNTPPELLDNPM